MKIMICTTPIRPVPTTYPPFGSLAVIQALRGAGYDPIFFDIDNRRPSMQEVAERIRREKPDIIGISAVVSTAYAYVKNLCRVIREVSPDTKIVLGGNLAASAEILHRFCGIDVCVTGEGEKSIVNLVNYYAKRHGSFDYSELQKIKGLSLLGENGEMVFTGYEDAIPAHELCDPDFSILEQYSNINHFIIDPLSRHDFARDPRSYESHRAGKKGVTVVSTKGCVARCTFCHRWDRGFRQIPPQKLIARIQHLIDRYNVGYILFGDENFGSDRRATEELIRLIKPLDVLWHVGGVRACSLDLDLLKRMHDAGCVALYYGFESGSPDILKVMEKKLDLADNFKAARSTYQAGLYTIYQLVLGMPGETHRTISETIEMVKQITEFLPDPPSKRLSTNYIQALPGTPVFEYARVKGLIGPRLEDEEAYLLMVSDIDAADDTKMLNFTHYPFLVVESWRPRILYETTMHWIRAREKQGLPTLRAGGADGSMAYEKGGYFNIHELSRNPRLLKAVYPIRWLFIWLWTLFSVYRRSSIKLFSSRVVELLVWPFRKHEPLGDIKSLRHIMRDIAPHPETPSQKSMVPLRLGR